ncbi:MAG TPA: STAS domain-containing protein [Nitrococcus sp.]|nr:STAS domain-containing protein [Nitrococcus sp.]
MSGARFATQGAQGLALLGELTFETVPGLNKDLGSTFAQYPQLRVDLSGLGRVDSAGLALLIEWTRLARSLGHGLEFVNVPQQLLAIARVSGLEQVLPFLRAEPAGEADGHRITGDHP